MYRQRNGSTGSKSTRNAFIGLLTLVLIGILVLPGCGKEDTVGAADKGTVTLTLGAYSVVKEAFEEIIPVFRARWKAETGQNVEFRESYEASGAQVRAITGGFEADVAVLALPGDLDRLADLGVIRHDWTKSPYGGMITASVAGLGVRQGNPKGIRDWKDLSRAGVDVLFANPKTSGGAQWIINAMYGAGYMDKKELGEKEGMEAGKKLLAGIYDRVISMDKSSRASMTTFENGVGDVIVTYENELLSRIKDGADYELIVPERTIRIENPAAIVDENVDAHGTRRVAEAFLRFLWAPEVQQIFVKHGFRPVVPEVEAQVREQEQTQEQTQEKTQEKTQEQTQEQKQDQTHAQEQAQTQEQVKGKGLFAQPGGLFTIEDLGGWETIRKEIFAPGKLWEQVLIGE